MKRGLIGIAAGLIAVLGAISLSDFASGATVNNLNWIQVRSTTWRNYDFASKVDLNTNVDWPVDFVYLNNSPEPAAIKSRMQAYFPCQKSYCVSKMNAYVSNDIINKIWTSDRGMKMLPSCPGDAYHQRLYAPGQGRFYNASWGYFVIATSHIDHNELCFPHGWSGKSETAEKYFAFWVSYVGIGAVWTDALRMYNTLRTSNVGGHYWENNGMATEAVVPS
jgi:hypothetical protein